MVLPPLRLQRAPQDAGDRYVHDSSASCRVGAADRAHAVSRASADQPPSTGGSGCTDDVDANTFRLRDGEWSPDVLRDLRNEIGGGTARAAARRRIDDRD